MYPLFALAFVLSLGTVVSNSFARFAYALVLPAMRDELGWNYSQSGVLNTANALGYLAGAVLTRALVNRVGNRALFMAGLPIMGAILGLFLARQEDTLLSLDSALGRGNAATVGANQPMILDGWVKNDGLGGVSLTTTDPDIHNHVRVIN